MLSLPHRPAPRGRVVVCLVALLALSSSAARAFGELPSTQPAPAFELADGVAVDALPLRSQRTTVDVAGVIARVSLEQVWENRGTVPLEATYVFPTSTRAAVHDLRIKIGDKRELRAEIRAKEQAQKIFDDARSAGQTAGLLEQQRPNAVTMHLTNVMPGDQITVTVESSELIRPIDGIYELVLPQTLGPRFAGNAGSEAFVDNGFVAPKASTVSTNVDVTVRSPTGVRGIGSPSHGVAPIFTGRDEGRVTLQSNADDVVADRDVVLRWRLASDQVETGVLLFRDHDRDEHFFMLVGEAPPEVKAKEALPREVVFVVDVSGSMEGFPLQNAKLLVNELMSELRPTDTFNILFFAGGSEVLSTTGSLPASRANLQAARTLLDRTSHGGGTQLLEALERTFALPRGDVDGVTRARAIVVVTDGMITAERAAFRLVHEHLGDATLFAFGIHGSVNRHLIEGLAAAGRTEPFVVVDPAQARRAVDHFRTVSARPALTNVRLQFDGFAATDLEPSAPTDLYPGRPLVVVGRFTGPSTGRVTVTGDGVDGPYRHEIPVEDHLERHEHAPLRQLWARERVARLADRDTPTAADLEEVQRLGLRYRLLTERTSFVVVDPARRNSGGDLAIVAQPAVLPRDMASLGTGIGGLTGASMSGVFGAGGLGSSGTGAGGGGYGSGVGGLGVGYNNGLGTRGRGDGNIDLGGRGKGTTRVAPGKVIYEGSMSRDTIERVIRRVMPQLKSCYEKRLLVVPTLQGKLAVRFTIGPNGDVTAIGMAADTVGDSEVATCAIRVMKRLQFPRPLGGGVVQVTYPLLFSNPP